MPDYSRITDFILTPLIFRYHLPLKNFSSKTTGNKTLAKIAKDYIKIKIWKKQCSVCLDYQKHHCQNIQAKEKVKFVDINYAFSQV
jgi:hypothetical protein